MAFALRNKQDVLKDLLTELRNTGVNYLPPGSKAKALANTFAREIDVVYKFFDSNFDSAYLNFASDDLLEALGLLFNVKKKKATKAFSLSSEQSVTFYVQNDGTFGSINGGSDIAIPAGVIASTPSNFTNSNPIQFQILNDITLGAGEKVGFATVEGLIEGKGNNAGPQTLITHDFTSYLSATTSPLKIVNRFAIVNGADIEADNLYRSRIAIAATALQRGNLAALRFALFSVPGVIDIRLLRYFDGIGSVGAFVAGQDNETPPSLLNQCQVALESFASAGEVVTAYSPNKVGAELTTHVNFSREVTINEQNQIQRKLVDATHRYFTQLRISDDASISGLVGSLLKTDSLIVNLGLDPGVSEIDELNVYRYSDASGQRVRRTILNTVDEISIENHEILIPESSIVIPFNFTFDTITP
jgi:hypothetical protein